MSERHMPLQMDENGVVLDANYRQVAAIFPGPMRDIGREMCAAYNHHAELVEALEAITRNAKRVDLHNLGAFSDIVQPHDIDAARSLLTRIKGGADA